MELTGKAKEAFEKWFNQLDMHKGCDYENDPRYFYVLNPSMKYGVYVDFFDSVDIFILAVKSQMNSGFSAPIRVNRDQFAIGEFKWSATRPEARTAAIEKANELYNERE